MKYNKTFIMQPSYEESYCFCFIPIPVMPKLWA